MVLKEDCRECKHCQMDDGKLWCNELRDFLTTDFLETLIHCPYYKIHQCIAHQRGIEWLTSVCGLIMKSHQHILRGMLQRCFYLLQLNPAEEQKYRMLAHLTKTEQLIHKTMEARK